MFGLKIKELREKEPLTQAEFAKKIGVSQSTVAAWELGTREPNIETLIKLSRYFNTSVDYLVGNNFSEIEKKYQPKSGYEREIIKLFNLLEPHYQVQILEYTQYFYERSKAHKGLISKKK